MINISKIIYKAILYKFLDFKNIIKYISSYKITFNKIRLLLVDVFLYIFTSIKVYLQGTISINIINKYFVLFFFNRKK